jgi:hypothetical protein
MTFTHKLARRLARLRPNTLGFGLLLWLGGCAAGEPMSPDSPGSSTGDTDGPAVLSPRMVTLEGTQSVLFRAFQSLIPGSAEVTSIEWTATGGTIASNGNFSSSSTGEFKVIGRRRGNPHNPPDTSTVTVVPPQPTLEALILTPTSATVGAGLQQQFTAVGRLTDDALVSVGVTWTATGGTIDPSGLYTAGKTAGTYQVTATHTTTGKTASATVTIPSATLTAIKLSPATVSVPVGTSVQFSTIGTLSDGSTATVPVFYSATGGTISYSGLYTAGTTTGTYRVIAATEGATKADTTTVTITTAAAPPPSPGGGLWRNEDFSSYTSDQHWQSDPWGWMITAPTWFNQYAIHIDRSVTYNGHPTLRMDWPNPPAGMTASAWCMTDITREAGYKAPDAPEVWIEYAHQFASNFNTNFNNAGGACSVAEYKFLMHWLKSPGTGRFDFTNGMWGFQWWGANPYSTDQTAYGSNCSGLGWKCRLGYGDGQDVYRSSVPSTSLYDGQWHIYRVHVKLPNTMGEATGVLEFWIDGKLVKRLANQTFIRKDGSFGNRFEFFSLGGNSNSGTSQATAQWWGHLKIWTANPGW